MLKVEGVIASYGVLPVLDGVNLELHGGEARCVIGANGAGKSTLLKVISGILKPISGRVTLDSVDLTNLSTDRVVGEGVILVPERRRLFSNMTVYENLLIGGYSSRARVGRKVRIEMVYRLFEPLERAANRLAGSLSGGEQQMLAIARGLMGNPQILMLDEPSIGLSPLVVKMIFKNLSQLSQQGVGILLAEQNAAIALKVTTIGYVMSHGKILLIDESKTLLQDERVRAIYLGKV